MQSNLVSQTPAAPLTGFDQPVPEQAGKAGPINVTPSAFDQMKARLSALPKTTRLSIIFGIPLSIAVIVALSFLLVTPKYGVLFNGLSDKDGGEITAALKQMGVPYQVSQSGSTIMVPDSRVPDVRLTLASQGLPKQSIAGLESMDSQPLGVTQFQEQVNYQRGLEGELAKSIKSLQAVESARVHLAIPKPSIFVRDEQKPSASVVIGLYRGKNLTQSQIDGIVHLVSSSLPDLMPGAVSIVDSTGRLLTKKDGDDANGTTSTQMTIQQQRERSYEEAIVKILAPLFGQENVKATVAADMDFSATERRLESYKPNSDGPSTIRSSQKSLVKDGSSENPSGIPGLLANTPPDGAQAKIGGDTRDLGKPNQPASGSGERRSDETVNYEVDKETVFKKEQIGQVSRLTAGVVVNYKTISNNGQSREVPLTPAELEEVNNLVKQAIGFNESRGDKIDVVNQAFSKPETVTTTFWENQSNLDILKSAGTPLAIALIAGLLVFGVIRPLMKPVLQRPQEEFDPLLPNAATAVPLLASAGGDSDDENFYETQVDKASRRLEKEREDRLSMVKTLAEQNPEIIASVVKGWIAGIPMGIENKVEA